MSERVTVTLNKTLFSELLAGSLPPRGPYDLAKYLAIDCIEDDGVIYTGMEWAARHPEVTNWDGYLPVITSDERSRTIHFLSENPNDYKGMTINSIEDARVFADYANTKLSGCSDYPKIRADRIRVRDFLFVIEDTTPRHMYVIDLGKVGITGLLNPWHGTDYHEPGMLVLHTRGFTGSLVSGIHITKDYGVTFKSWYIYNLLYEVRVFEKEGGGGLVSFTDRGPVYDEGPVYRHTIDIDTYAHTRVPYIWLDLTISDLTNVLLPALDKDTKHD